MSRNSSNLALIPFDPEPERTFHKRLRELHQITPETPEQIPTMPKLSDHSMPTAGVIPKGFDMPGTIPANFEFKPSFLNLIERNQFGGGATEDPSKHIQIFCDYCSTIKQTGITQSQIRETMFPFSLRDSAREWITDLDRAALGIDNWDKLALAFYSKYFPPEKTATLRSQITNFRQTHDEAFHEAWERFKKLIRECPHHGLDEWFLVIQFYNGLYEESRSILDSAANGRFANNIDDDKARTLIEEMATHSKQYGKPRGNSKRANNDIDTASSLSAQLAALTTKIDQLSGVNSNPQYVNAIENQSVVSCGACGMLGHTSLECRSGQEQVHAFQSYQQNNPYSGTYNENTRNHPNFSWKSNNVLNPPIQQQQATYQKPYQPPGFQRPLYTPPQPTSDISRLETLLTQSMASQATFQQQSLAAQASFQQQTQATLKAHDEKLQQLMAHTKLIDTQIAQLATSSSTRQQGYLPPQGQKPHETANAITLRSGTEYKGPEVPTDERVEGLVEEDEDAEGEDLPIEEAENSEKTTFTRSSNITLDRVNTSVQNDENTRSSVLPTGRVISPEKLDATFTRSSKALPDRVKSPAHFDQNTRSSNIITDRVKGAEVKNLTVNANSKEPEKIAIRLPFPQRQINHKMEQQFQKFMEVVKNLEVTVPFTDLITQIPTYAKFLKDIITRKRSLNTSETVAFTEECSQILQGRSPPKLNDPGSFSITCTIGSLVIDKALCDLGASVSIMPYSICKKLNMGDLKCTSMTLQMADRSIKHPLGILEDVPVRIGKNFIPVDFVVLDMPEDAQIPIILGRPFLHTAGAVIDVKNGNLTLEVAGEKITFNLSRALKSPMLEEPVYFVDIVDDAVEEVWHDSLERDPLAALRYFDDIADTGGVSAVETSIDAPKKTNALPRTKEEQIQPVKREWVEIKKKLPKQRKEAKTFPFSNEQLMTLARKQLDDLREDFAAKEIRLVELINRIKPPDAEKLEIGRFGGT